MLLRLLSCPFEQLLLYLPQSKKLLDVGCGYGLMPFMLAMRNNSQRIVGIDPDNARIKIALETSKEFANLTFKKCTIFEMKSQHKFGIITIVDVLYLLPFSEKEKVLRKAYQLLTKKGKIFIKINDRSKSFGFFLTRLQELITVHLLRKTKTQHANLYFENVKDVKGLLKKTGFKFQASIKLPTPFPFFHPHNLIIAIK